MQVRRPRLKIQKGQGLCHVIQGPACWAGGVHAVLDMLRKLKGMGSSSVGWHSMLRKSTVLASMRGGVPVFNRLSLKP